MSTHMTPVIAVITKSSGSGVSMKDLPAKHFR